MIRHAKKIIVFGALATLVLALVLVGQGMAQDDLTAMERLGSSLYFDENLSEPAGQSCASCHDPDFGFVDPDSDLPVSEGVIPGMFGGRNSPAAAYAMYAPMLHLDMTEGLWIGGQFWDGRATGDELGDPLADQALGPFLNPVEMHNPDKGTVIDDVAASDYAGLFEEVWGIGSLDDVESAYDQVALSIAAFERSPLFGQFSSKYDYYLQSCLVAGGGMDECAMGIGKVAEKTGKKIFTSEEWYGMQLFMGENNNDGTLDKGEGAMCAACHVASFTPDPGNVVVPDWSPTGWVPPMFTDFTFDNLGVPKNTAYPLDPDAPVDLGLGPIVGHEEENGKFKVMTLRNIGLTAPYAHNGFFVRLKDIAHFYNTRDAMPMCDAVNNPKPGKNCWDPAEYPGTMNVDELGNLGLSEKDEDALVEFMKTLSDGWKP